MEDLVAMLVAIIIAVVSFFYIPTVSSSELSDSAIDTFVVHETDVWGDQVCNNGYITYEMYTSLLENLSKTDLTYNVDFERVHTVYYPIYNPDGTFSGDAKEITEKNYTDEIKEKIVSDGIYYLREGDTFSVTVRSRSLTMSQKIHGLIGIKNNNGINAFGGGIVKDENY